MNKFIQLVAFLFAISICYVVGNGGSFNNDNHYISISHEQVVVDYDLDADLDDGDLHLSSIETFSPQTIDENSLSYFVREVNQDVIALHDIRAPPKTII